MIEISNLTMQLTSGGRTVTILDGIDLSVPAKQFLAVVGPSGSGKSTLLGLIAGLDRPTSGSIRIDGVSLSALSEDDLARLRREKVGMIFQSFHLIPTLTALENVQVPLELRGEGSADREAIRLLDAVGLGDRKHHYPVQLSGGEQQRVAVARAYSAKPALLLADEPTGNLDSANGARVIDLLLQLHRDQGSTLILVTHDPSLAARAERVLSLRDGKVVGDELRNEG
ncbi:ABC transporter ATP-binding protein [Candidatus Manganitrophus noduliformans]|uniref:ABC transporter ATP-binding protein n=1 Tax=Candidatus Manganitrophus noduliformans TaxID=2606439 RepID=A0A7X6DRW1_9BACT|nr:ABC transporter ATP-binding protein [Candidatus Manganitrophus noduliformans]NKE72209.1 ABC transporter ATP-binding protein [Candidatus Manganitrophus noduliformans]